MFQTLLNALTYYALQMILVPQMQRHNATQMRHHHPSIQQERKFMFFRNASKAVAKGTVVYVLLGGISSSSFGGTNSSFDEPQQTGSTSIYQHNPTPPPSDSASTKTSLPRDAQYVDSTESRRKTSDPLPSSDLQSKLPFPLELSTAERPVREPSQMSYEMQVELRTEVVRARHLMRTGSVEASLKILSEWEDEWWSPRETESDEAIHVRKSFALWFALYAYHRSETGEEWRALEDVAHAIRLDPENAVYKKMQTVLAKRYDPKWQRFETAIIAAWDAGKFEQALTIARRAEKELKCPASMEWQASMLSVMGRYREAADAYDRSIDQSDRDDDSHRYHELADLKTQLGQHQIAWLNYGHAIDEDPNSACSYWHYAWFLATCPDPLSRNGDVAIEYAHKAAQLSNFKHLESLVALAAAHAEKGNFNAAVKWQEEALALATTDAVEKVLTTQCEKYRAHQPMRITYLDFTRSLYER